MLSSDDPVRVFQRYSTLNAVSGGRAEVILGRGSSIDSFPLFGYDLADYEELFEEKTNLFAELLKGGPVTWQGKTRAALVDQDVVPHLESGPLPGLDRRRRQPPVGHPRRPLRLLADARDHRRLTGALRAVLRAVPRRRWNSSGSRRCRSACTRPGTSPPPTSRPREEFWPHYLEVITPRQQDPRLRASRPRSRSCTRSGRDGALYVGSPETVAQKIAANLTALGANRFDLKYGMGGLSHDSAHDQHRAVRDEGGVPRVRELLA